jgi:23S rRNA (uracil1939-C5)-methyltransferase
MRYNTRSMEQGSEGYRIEKLVHGGMGLCRDEDGVILVDQAVPGDLLELDGIRRVRGVRRAGIKRIIEAGDGRIEPPCPHYGSCGGCDLQHIAYDGQLGIKAAILADSLVRQGGFDPEDPVIAGISVEGGEPWKARNRFQFHMTGDGPGLMKRGSNEIYLIDACPVAHPAINEFLAGGWRSLPTRQRAPGFRLPVFAAGDRLVAGGGEVMLTIRGTELRFDVRGFFQSSLAGLEQLLDFVLSQVDENPPPPGAALDLYCGAGLFGALLPPAYELIHAVEINRKSLDYARINIGRRGRYHPLSMDAWVRQTRPRDLADISLAIVDPPRTGLDRELRQLILEILPPRLIYVSCDPVTFARDIKELRTRYTILALRAFDLSPQNHHIESVAVLEARGE